MLRNARLAAGLSQTQAARRLGISQSRLSQLELGNRRLAWTDSLPLVELYGITVADLDPRGRPSPENIADCPPRRRL
ncbi:MAG TPA: helix-turn-helix transcriptional regulator [Coriobacteriia bacterium]|nr:helix-turn-helix transcriptional regulator [Coriobacteriia bacterium]